MLILLPIRLFSVRFLSICFLSVYLLAICLFPVGLAILAVVKFFLEFLGKAGKIKFTRACFRPIPPIIEINLKIAKAAWGTH